MFTLGSVPTPRWTLISNTLRLSLWEEKGKETMRLMGHFYPKTPSGQGLIQVTGQGQWEKTTSFWTPCWYPSPPLRDKIPIGWGGGGLFSSLLAALGAVCFSLVKTLLACCLCVGGVHSLTDCHEQEPRFQYHRSLSGLFKQFWMVRLEIKVLYKWAFFFLDKERIVLKHPN